MVEKVMSLRQASLSLLCSVALFCTGCGVEYPYFSCDIRTEDCQTEIYTGVAELMGGDPNVPPPIRTISIEQYEFELRNVDEEFLTGDDAWTRSLRLMGFLPEGTSSYLEDWIQSRLNNFAGYYCGTDSDSRLCPVSPMITVIDRGYPEGDATYLLAHEFAHAVQDQQFGLTGIVDGTTEDELLIRNSIVEGDAQHFAEAWIHAASGMTVTPALWDEIHAYPQQWALDRARDPTISIVDAVFGFPYGFGFEFMIRVTLHSGLEGRAAVWASPPSSSLSFLLGGDPSYALSHPEVAHPAPPSEYDIAFKDRMGALYLFVFLRRLEVPEDIAWDHALLWAGDNFTAYEDGTRIAVTWRIRFAGGGEDSAEAVARAVNGPSSVTDAFAVADGRDVFIVATEDGSSLGWDAL
jgi:hypothetical protein